MRNFMRLAVSRTAAALVATLVSATAAFAAADPAGLASGTYKVEPLHTRVMFSIDHMGFSTYFGEFVGASGSLVLDPKDLATAKLDVSVPVAAVATTSGKLDGELKGADWLDAAKDPTIRFTSTSVRPTGKDTAQVMGDLTLHGVTKPVTLNAVLHGQGINPLSMKTTVGFDVRGKIRRSDFGVKKYVPLIGDEVDLIISAAFEKTN